MRAIASKIRQNAERLARVITEEGGKIQSLALVEVNFTADYLDYMAEWARRIEGEIITSDRPGENIFLFRKPLGVVAGILPWNFPFFLIARKMAPALVTGNTMNAHTVYAVSREKTKHEPAPACARSACALSAM